MTNSAGKSNGVWKTATVALLSVVLTLIGAYATSHAAFFHDAVPRAELKSVAEKQQDQGERLSRLEGNIEGRLKAIEQGVNQLAHRLAGGD